MTRLVRVRRWFVLVCFVLLVWSIFSPKLFAQNTEQADGLTERQQERLVNLAANISNRMEATIARLDQISGRVNSRIDKLDASGTDTRTATAARLQAEAALERAAQALSKIDVQVVNAVGSTDPRLEWQTVRASYLEAKGELRTARRQLLIAVELMKNPTGTESSLVNDDLSATSTDQQATSTENLSE